MINFKDLKKGHEIKSDQLGPGVLISGKLLESPLQGRGIRKTILIDAKGSEVGLFDEAGSVYSTDIKLAKVNGNWEKVVHANSLTEKEAAKAIEAAKNWNDLPSSFTTKVKINKRGN